MYVLVHDRVEVEIVVGVYVQFLVQKPEVGMLLDFINRICKRFRWADMGFIGWLCSVICGIGWWPCKIFWWIIVDSCFFLFEWSAAFGWDEKVILLEHMIFMTESGFKIGLICYLIVFDVQIIDLLGQVVFYFEVLVYLIVGNLFTPHERNCDSLSGF